MSSLVGVKNVSGESLRAVTENQSVFAAEVAPTVLLREHASVRDDPGANEFVKTDARLASGADDSGRLVGKQEVIWFLPVCP
jgi:hypothetical protein